MLKLKIFDTAAFVAMAFSLATAAHAGMVTPAPVAGVGIGALALLGLGYRALRKRIDR
jgi:hypothetical protein